MDIEKAFDKLYPVEDKINGTPKDLIAGELDDRGYWSQGRDFVECHNYFYLYACPMCGTEYLVPVKCGFRFCNNCGDVKLNRYSNRLSALFEEKTRLIKSNPVYKDFRVRRLEMGLPPVDQFNVEVFKDLRYYFNVFRDEYLNEQCGDFGGGVYGLEVKFSRKGDVYTRCNGESYVIPETGFNFHVHAVVVSKYLPNKPNGPVLSWMWQKATGGRAKRAWVDEAKSWRHGLFETLKYCFKPPTLREPEYYVDFYEDTKKLRLYASFGSFHGVKLPEKEKGRYGCRFDGAVLEKDSLSIIRNEAIEKEASRVIPKHFLDAYMGGSKGVLRPVVVRGDAS
jgi:hypothetical protein